MPFEILYNEIALNVAFFTFKPLSNTVRRLNMGASSRNVTGWDPLLIVSQVSLADFSTVASLVATLISHLPDSIPSSTSLLDFVSFYPAAAVARR